jgi:hypothetical protein
VHADHARALRPQLEPRRLGDHSADFDAQ